MRCLLDTCTALWMLQEPKKLSSSARELIEDMRTEVFVSTISLWEISLKHSIGKLEVQDIEIEDIVEILVEDFYVGIIGLNEQESLSFCRLPFLSEHQDPFDRALVWQAIKRDMTLLSADPALEIYRQCGLRVIW